MMNMVLVQCVTCYVNSNSAQKAKNVCRILTGKVDNYVQLFLTDVDPHDCNVPREALPRAWIANSPAPKPEHGSKGWLLTTCSATWKWSESVPSQVQWPFSCTDKETDNNARLPQSSQKVTKEEKL